MKYYRRDLFTCDRELFSKRAFIWMTGRKYGHLFICQQIEPYHVHWARTLQNTRINLARICVMWSVYIMCYGAGLSERMVPEREGLLSRIAKNV